ncbi:MAG: ABC transporter permease subunit [Propionibacteriaceae bacterium]|nr:ABC transporter permease subunit [Propionibacteriaceae bacterium]
MVTPHRKSLLGRLALQASVLVVLLVLWAAASGLGIVSPLYLPGPAAVWDAFVNANTCRPIAAGSSRIVCGEQGYFMWEHLLSSLGRMGIGLGAALVVGPILGLLMGINPWVRTAVEPYLNFLRALPPLGYIGLVIIWFGIGDQSKWLLLFLAAFPPITIATISGITSVKADQVHAAESLGGNRAHVTCFVLLPSVLPELLSGIRIAAGFAWTTVVAAELNNGLPGIGALAYVSGQQLNSALVIACILVIGISAVILDSIFVWLRRVLVPWQGRS